MRNHIARLVPLWATLVCWTISQSLLAQPNAASEDPKAAAADKEACSRNLKVIYDAIQLYQIDHKDVPSWLSDLVPQYLDANVLICPACRRTGEIESSALADPKLPCSYLYEFCPVALGKNDAPGDPTKTRRDWKRRQMGLVGSVVPIVRCRHHATMLNLGFDGRVYESPPSWEDLLTNRMDIAELQSARIFADTLKTNTPAKPSFPPRDSSAKTNLIDLTKFYDAALTESWHGNPNNDLGSLPTGIQNFAGVDYDVRGIIQLSGKPGSLKRFPEKITGIKVRQKCARLHFLHAAGFGKATDDGLQIGSYVIHFATNQMQLEVPIVYGHDLRNWHKLRGETPAPDLNLVWTGANEDSAFLRLFSTTWTNIVPSVAVESIDFVSAMSSSAPFLIAITADPP